MSPRRFAVTIGLLLSTLVISTAGGQTTRQPGTLAERMAAMRRGWSQGSAHKASDGTAGNPNARQNPGTDNQAGLESGEESRSLIPNFFSRRANRSTTSATGQTSAQANQRAGSATATQPSRIATRTSAGPAQSTASQHEGFTLPGLGGSPLPSAKSAASRTSSTPKTTTAGGPDISREITGDYPVIRGDRPSTGLSRFATQPQTATSNPRTSAATSPRQSPSRRIAPHVDPDQLRRELAGSFGKAPARKEPATRTARADNSTSGLAAGLLGQSPTTADDASPKTDPYSPPPTAPGSDRLSSPKSAGGFTAEPTTNASIDSDITDSTNNSSNTSSAEAERAFGDAGDLGSAFSATAPEQAPRTTHTPITRPSARSQQAFGETGEPTETAGDNDPTVLVSNQTPVITTDIRGPKQILVGREATYRVQLRNQSDLAAEGIVATIRIPAWAEVVDTTTTHGMIQQARVATESGDLQWQLARLEARGNETLDIRLVPRASRPLELGVSWTLTPVGSRAIVEVQEPKLQMTVAGPDEVLFSEPQLFRLTLSNPGTGVAEGVKINLLPPGGGEEAATSHPVGDLPPGSSKTIEVELTAREAGKLFVKAVATAEGGLTSDAAKEIFCRKPELEVDWRGPETKYAGTHATYFFRVRNPGTAPAENVAVQVTLPEGAEFTSASEGQSYDASERRVEWQIGTLSPGDDNYMELKCVVNTAGANQFRVNASSTTGDLTASKLAETNVVALADLKLEVSDPSGPVAVGDQAVYEIRVQNRGANSAKEVNIVALFSQGIEPDQVEGAMYTVADGRVTFRTIDELPAGRETVLRIRAHAVQAGTHVFRAEVLCRDLDIKLAAEETTRFYADDVQPNGQSAAEQSATRSEAFQPVAR